MRIVRFYVSCLLLLLLVSSSSSSPSSPPPPPRPPRPPCRPHRPRRPRRPHPIATRDPQYSLPDLTTTIHTQCSLPDLKHDHLPNIPCRTSTTTIHAQCSLPDLNREYPCQIFPAGPQPRLPDRSGHCRPLTGRM